MSFKVLKVLQKLIKRWLREEDALAAVEASFIFPIMLTILVGLVDVGNGVLANQKAVRSAQVVADIVARENVVSDSDVTEAIEAGRLAFEPLNSESYGVDIISMRFDDLANAEIVWRETQNMIGVADPLADVDALAVAGEGVVMVAVKYDYVPIFADFVIDSFTMEERAFTRGRRAAVVAHE